MQQAVSVQAGDHRDMLPQNPEHRGGALSRLAREPLLHFLVLGAGLFVLFAVVGGEDPGSRRIVVGSGTVENLAALFERTWLRPPTERELDGLIADHVREEIFTREATALGLDRDDVIVRRRLRQKMELLSAGFGASAEPSDAELEEHLRIHADRYRREPRLSFRQVYVSRERRGAEAERAAAGLLEPLRAGHDPSEIGDPFPLPLDNRELSLSEVSRQYGEAFAAKLAEIEPGAWTGPVESGYGPHLVFVELRSEGFLPPLAEIRERVLADWQAAQGETATEAYYDSLRERYEVVIERPADAAGDGAGRSASQ
jgi:hypothetical protein